ncbi:MAG: type 4a pilus biogenesis protein PilO [Fimbriimonadales bacterium]
MAASRRIQRVQRLVKVLSIGVLVTLLLSVGSLYLPYQGITRINEALEQKRKELEQAQQATSQLRLVQQEYEQTRRELQFLERGVSEYAYIPTMLQQIEQTAKNLNLEIAAIRPQQPAQQSTQDQKEKAKKPYEEQMIEISIRGNFWSLMRFLKQLDEYPKILAIQTIQVQSKAQNQLEMTNTNPQLEIRTTVRAFIFKSHNPPANAQGGSANAS